MAGWRRPTVLVVAVAAAAAAAVQLSHVCATRPLSPNLLTPPSTFILGTKPFEGIKRPVPRAAAATAPNRPPERAPDLVVEEATTLDQAALYR